MCLRGEKKTLLTWFYIKQSLSPEKKKTLYLETTLS